MFTECNNEIMVVLIRGRVQGVGFRWYVHREAAEIACAAGCATPIPA
jgi:acylphosphatase